MPTVGGCIVLCFAASANLCGDEPVKELAPGEIQWSEEASHTVLPPNGQEFWVRLRLKAPELKQAERDPLNLSVVFDRSASMNVDSKIGYVRKTGHILADNLTPRDFVSLIAYIRSGLSDVAVTEQATSAHVHIVAMSNLWKRQLLVCWLGRSCRSTTLSQWMS